MRLKSLELQGFKSFPDRTKLNFDTGMTVVIGPNGSGKSNIADAIRWVLGEISSKNIRGSKMEDVIFGGTDSRRPMGYAEVSLTFDNTEGEIALPVSYDEVTVTRKYYRSGDSEYMINGQNVRLRDITELFMNTGIGKSGYSVIGQGRIAEIVSKKSEDRRGIFEEAAGISKYRARKNEAERKLERADDNLARVTDILSELGSRVGPLEKDAEKARKYLELYAQKKEADVGLWLYEIDSVRSRSAKLEERFEITKHELEMAEDTLSGLDRQTELLLQRMRENKEKSENARRDSIRLSEEKHRAIAAVQICERDARYCDEEEKRVSLESEKRSAEGAALIVKKEEAEREISDQDGRIARCVKDLESLQTKIEELRAQIAEIALRRDRAEEEIDQVRSVLQEQRLELSGLEGSKSGEAQRKKELEEQSEELREQIEGASAGLLRAEKTLAEYTEKMKEQQQRIEILEAQLKADRESSEESRRAEGELRVELNTLSERIALLRRMEEHFEGYAGSVRHIMQCAGSGQLRGVCGPVSKLLRVDKEYALAYETALGASLQHIVTEDDAAAKDAIRELQRSGNGRATFYPLNTVVPQPLDVDSARLSRMPGFIGWAHEKADYDRKYDGVMKYLLCRTVLCDTLDHASEIARAFSYRFKAVSLDGQVINAGGSFTGGSVRKEAGILSRSAEIERLQAEKNKKEEKLRASEDECAKLQKRIGQTESDRDLEAQSAEILRVLANGADTDVKVRKAGLETDLSRQQALEVALRQLGEEMKNFNSRRAQIEERISNTASLLAQKQIDADKLSVEQEALEQRRNACIDDKNALLLQKGSFEKDRALTLRLIAETEERILQTAAAVRGLADEKEALKNKKAEAQKKRAEAEKSRKALEEQLSELESADETLRRENEEFETKSAEIRKKQKEASDHREILLRDYTRLEGSLEAIKSEQERYTTRLWDEYELTYAASKELNYPVVTEENRGETVSRQNKLKNRLRELGSVNVGAIEEYAEVKERFDELTKQYDDLTKAREELGGVISGLERDMRLRFSEVFSQINENFRTVFAELFGGGTAELSLSDPENILESGIEISVAPPGKIIKNLSLLSGGEQVFVAIAIFFAILRVNPAPFCLLDEIEAALDEVNVARFASYAKAYSAKTQFIIITHRRGTMEEADTMYGVTMSERGISKVLPLRFDEAEQQNFVKT